MKVSGFTNRILRKTKLFGGGIISSDKCLELHNELDVNFCTEGRHKVCSRSKKCNGAKPQCVMDEKQMVGRSTLVDLTNQDRKKIQKMLTDAYKKCRIINIEIKEN